MFAKFRANLHMKLFPCEQIIKNLLADHETAMEDNRAAREKLQVAVQRGQVERAATLKAQGMR